MSEEYTYVFPDPERFVYTLRQLLEKKGEEDISSLLRGTKCEFVSSHNYSRIRWNTYHATIRFSVSLEQLDKILDYEDKLFKYSGLIFPKEAGYELTDIEISPLLEEPPNENIIDAASVTVATKLARYSPVWGEPITSDNYSCDVFMVMPFDNHLNTVYTDVIKPTVGNSNLSIRRGDDPFTDKDIMYDVWCMINACQLVIADCTGRNPNVFYELGIAHTLGKPVIMITQNIDDLPFDVQNKRAIEYNTNFDQIDKFKTELEQALNSILRDHTESK